MIKNLFFNVIVKIYKFKLKMFQKYNKKSKNILLAILLAILLVNCSNKEAERNEDQIFKKKRINPNIDQRARESADKGGDILSKMRNNNTTTFEFGTSNVLWRATLKSLDFMPLLAVDYAGGVIVTDWYGKNLNNQSDQETEELKITVKFLSNELSVSSLQVDTFKKKCIQFVKCSTMIADKKLNSNLKNKIIETARQISIEDEKNNSSKKKK